MFFKVLLREREDVRPILQRISAVAFSKKRESIPVAPTLPISSLSTRIQTHVLSMVSASKRASREVKEQILSSCPYPRTIDLSSPRYFAFPLGTTSSSADKKSFSSMLYFSFRIARILSLALSFLSPSFFSSFALSSKPTTRSRSSPGINSPAVFFI